MSRSGTLSRRGFLGIGGAAIAVSLVSGAVILAGDDDEYARIAGGYQPATLGLKEFAVLCSLAAVMIAPHIGGPTAHEAMTAARIDRELSFHRDSTLAEDVAASLLLLEHLPLLEGYGSRFSSLPAVEQNRFLAAAAGAGPGITRAAYTGIRFLVVFFYYTDERSWPGLGYAGPQMSEKLFEGGNRIANLTGRASPPSNENVRSEA